MIHRSRRQPAALPARRGMRASWFRGRYTSEEQLPAEPTHVTGPLPAGAKGPDEPAVDEPSDTPFGPEAVPRTTDAASVAPVRPVHGHPTF